jgi:hypothetical protein
VNKTTSNFRGFADANIEACLIALRDGLILSYYKDLAVSAAKF